MDKQYLEVLLNQALMDLASLRSLVFTKKAYKSSQFPLHSTFSNLFIYRQQRPPARPPHTAAGTEYIPHMLSAAIL